MNEITVTFPTATSPTAQADFYYSNARYCRAVTGYGGGKTYALVAKMVKLAAMNPGLEGLIVEPTHGMVADILLPTIERFCDDNGLTYRFVKPAGRIDWLLDDFNFRFMLRSGDNPSRLVGTSVACAGIDEAGLQDGDVYRKVVSRVRDARAKLLQINAVGTPDGLNWFYTTWANNQGNADFASFNWTTSDNAANLAEGYDGTLKENYSPEQYRAYSLGEFVALTQGIVFSNFSGANIQEWRPMAGQPIIWGMDFNVDPMCASAWQQVGDQIKACGELVLRHTHTEEFSKRMLEMFPLNKYPGTMIACDPTGKARSSTSGFTNIDILEQAGFKVEFRHVRHEMDAINAGRRMICDATGRRRVSIDAERCPRLLTAVKSWAFKEDSMRTKEEEYRGDKDLFFVPHMADTLKYLAHALYPIAKPSWSVG